MIRVCLHMIVKNERDAIRRCLRSVRPHVDAWCVVDTGSEDGTQDIVREELDGLPGALHELPWKGFAESRNDGLRLAREVIGTDLDGWLLFTIDADEILHVDPTYTWPTEPFDCWHVKVKLGPHGFTRRLLTRASVPWKYRGAIHEDLDDKPGRTIGPPLNGVYVESTRDGARASDPCRFANDVIALLREEAEAPPDEPEECKARRYFYIANSLRDGYLAVRDRRNIEHALQWYTRCAQTPGDPGEKWACMHARAGCMIELGRSPAEVLEAHLLAYAQHEPRAETLLQLARWFRATSTTPAVAGLFEQAAERIPKPSHGMFVDDACYPKPPRIGIITAPRDGGQFPLPITITSAIAADHRVSPDCIRVFYDSTGVLRLPGGIGWENATQEVLDRIRTGGIWGTLNLIRALEWAAGADEISITCEDDLVFSRNWLGRAKTLLEAAERETKGPVVINGHDMYSDLSVLRDSGIEVDEDRLFDATPRTWPNGSQLYVMRPATALMLAAELSERMGLETPDERKGWAMDVGVLRCCLELGIARMLFSGWNLVWHNDAVPSTWASKDPRWAGRDAEHRKLRATKRFRPW